MAHQVRSCLVLDTDLNQADYDGSRQLDEPEDEPPPESPAP
jgi:hypothetical protein